MHAARRGKGIAFFVSEGGEASTQRGCVSGACVDAWRSGEDARTKGMLGVPERFVAAVSASLRRRA